MEGKLSNWYVAGGEEGLFYGVVEERMKEYLTGKEMVVF